MNTALKITKPVPETNNDGWVPATGYDMPPSKGELVIFPAIQANDNLATVNDGQRHLANVKNGIQEWDAELNKVRVGRCETAHQAFKAVIYFVCWCMDETNSPETDLPNWGDTKRTYRKAVDYAFEHAGIAETSPIKSETSKRSQWAKGAEYIHNDGEYRVQESDFLDFFKTVKGGIRGLNNNAVKVLGKKSPGRNGKNGKPKTGSISSASADAKIKADLATLHQQMKEQPDYVLILLDANQGKGGKRKDNPKSPQAIANYIGKMDEFVVAWNPSNDDVDGDGGIMAMFREDEPLDVADSESDVETEMVSGGDDE